MDIPVAADTLVCLHGDTPGAAALAAAIRLRFERHGVEVRRLGAATRADRAGSPGAAIP